jgi:hypothetical protein
LFSPKITGKITFGHIPSQAPIGYECIAVGAWGYVYLKWNALGEANRTADAVKLYDPDFYLIDAEAYAKWQFAPAWVYAKRLRARLPYMPLGLNSYWYPPYHPSLPWKQIRSMCNFDAPQVYWRGYRPVDKLVASKYEYAKMSPKLPFALPAGDMYYERGIKPTPAQVIEFLDACRNDTEITGAVMWSMDQKAKVPELWDAYSRYDWKTGTIQDGETTIPLPEIQPLYVAVVTPWRGLNVRSQPIVSSTTLLRAERQGTRVEVYVVEDGWAYIKPDRSEWMYAHYLKKV